MPPAALTLSEWIGPDSVAADPGLGTRFVKSMSSLRDRQDHREAQKMSHEPGSRNFPRNRQENLPGAEIVDMDEWRFRERFADSLDATGKPDKELARDFGVTPQTVRNWKAKENGPTAYNLLRGAACNPEMAGEVRRLLGMHDDLDPEFARDLNAFITAAMRMRRT